MKTLVIAGSVAATLSAAVQIPRAQAALFDFDGVPSGTPVVVVSHSGVTFSPAVLQPDLDGFGDPIPGTDKWRVDNTAPALTVDNPLLFGRGAAPSPDNALNALFQPVLMQLPEPTDFLIFHARLDYDSFGDASLTVNFYNAADTLLASVPIDETIPGFFITAEGLTDVSKVLLPAGAFYDNISFASVPEVGSGTIAASLLSLAGAYRLGRKLKK